MLEKQNLAPQHISDLCCYRLKVSGDIPYGIHEAFELSELGFASNLEGSLDNLGILTSITFKRYLT